MRHLRRGIIIKYWTLKIVQLISKFLQKINPKKVNKSINMRFYQPFLIWYFKFFHDE